MKGDELWLNQAYFPFGESSVGLDIKNDNGARIADMTFTQIQTKVLNKDHIPCKIYPQESNNNSNLGFVQCCKEAVWSQLQHAINCSIAPMDEITDSQGKQKKFNYRVCHGFRFTTRDDNFQVDFDHF